MHLSLKQSRFEPWLGYGANVLLEKTLYLHSAWLVFIILLVKQCVLIITDCYFLMFSRRYFKDMPQIALDKKSNFEYIE